MVVSSDGAQGGGGTSMAQPAGLSDELKSVPPDVVVAVSDTFVTAGQPIEVVRPIRDEIGQRVRALLSELGVPAAEGHA